MGSERRTYRQFCGLASALDVLGERWTLLVVREMLLGPRRFGELMEALDGVSPNLLSERLRFLVEEGVAVRDQVFDDGRGVSYRLTPRGEELRGPLLGLAKWGLNVLRPDDEAYLSRPEWGFLAVQAMVAGRTVAGTPDEEYEFRVDDARFHLVVKEGTAEARLGAASAPAVVATTDASTFVRIGARFITPFEAVIAGKLTLEGDPEAVHRCSELMGLV